ncbi:hypothetical protein [Borrelia sp. P9F1]|uniref:hypothetical protein n=1 Tax=Borrelia sp. P9F1 TaxID=3058374 RepID=UPI0026492038|nr:hypothetical protein [Borrelia sp. P9F1]WKC58512.1 hypothetical protein QYZ68_04655 [Borrelia sp. P9F1]
MFYLLGVIAFIFCVFVSGFCVTRIFDLLFKDSMGYKRGVRVVYKYQVEESKGVKTGDASTVHVQNLGFSKGKQQQAQQQESFNGSVLTDQDREEEKKRRERLKRDNAVRRAAVALNKQIRLDKFRKGKF